MMSFLVKFPLILLTSLIFLGKGAFAQYHVIQVIGHIQDKKKNPIKVGSTFNSSSKLVFTSPNDTLRALDENGEVRILTSPVPKNEGVEQRFKKFKGSIKDFINKRITALQSGESPFADHFTESLITLHSFPTLPVIDTLPNNNKQIIADSNRYGIDTLLYPVAKGKFILQGIVDGKIQQSQMLRATGNILHINYNDFLSLRHGATSQTYEVIYQPQKGSPVKILPDVHPNFDVAGETPAMIYEFVKDRANKTSKESLYKEVYNTVSIAFGKPFDLDFQREFDLQYSQVKQAKPPVQITSVYSKIQIGTATVSQAAKLAQLGNFKDIQQSGIIGVRKFAPEPGFQGQTNTCTAWACAYAAFCINYNDHGSTTFPAILEDNYFYNLHSFSPEFVFKGVDSVDDICSINTPGINIGSALDFMSRSGVIKKTNTDFVCPNKYSDDQKRIALGFRVYKARQLFGYSRDPLTDIDILLIKQAIMANKPVIISMFLPQAVIGSTSFDSLKLAHSTATWLPNSYERDINRHDVTHNLSHAMCITGFDNDPQRQCFEVLNSYGKDWGCGGYFYIRYEDFKIFGIEAYVIDNQNDAAFISYNSFSGSAYAP